AVLWAAFRAYGHTPPLSVVVMGYTIGSLGAALPVPGGIGAAEGGLIGALVLYGTPVASAAAAVLLYRSVSLALPSALGALAWGLGPLTALFTTVGLRRDGRRRRALKPQPAADVAFRMMHERDLRQQFRRPLLVSGGTTAVPGHRVHAEGLTDAGRAIPQA
ncbi:MAG: lysylphosphatidylglycerol synthase domain-containing protein, partial [Actinomycetota bacterium]|nr:lysylphosphatidylglycerol synthase domain-containing protein [Actinomycetota bacterium]